MSFYAGLRKGSLNLGIITSLQCINFGGMLSAFCGSYPDISVNIVQEGTHRLLDLLLDRKVDLAFSTAPCPSWPPAWSSSSWGRITTPWQSPVSTPWPVVRRSACGS